jgi:GAF domain-containing protein
MFSFSQQRGTADADEKSLITVFRIYLLICSLVYALGTLLELTVDFQASSVATFIFLTLFPLLLIGLSVLGVTHSILLFVNMIFIFAINEVQILLNPKAFHVLVYWIGIMPLVVAVLIQQAWQTIMWTVLLIIFIMVNGLYVSKTAGAYAVTIYPERFIAGGFLFAIMTCSVAVFFSYVQAKSRAKLKTQNDALLAMKSEIENQRDLLNLKNDRLETYIKSILELSQSREVINGEFDLAVQKICKMLDYIMKIAQVSYWTYEEEDNTITCRYTFPSKEQRNIVHDLDNFPRYATRLKAKSIIVARNAQLDPNTSEFGPAYLSKQNIKAMLDAPLIINGKMVGIICCEDVQERNWNAEDVLFVSAACDILTIAFKAMQAKQYIQEIESKNDKLLRQSEEIRQINGTLKSVNEHLEERVMERTKELEDQNRQLSEYAFINSHLLRAPLSSILGLIHVINASELSTKEKELITHLYESGMKLDSIIHKISEKLEQGATINRHDLVHHNGVKKSHS